jgi:hypothetical protein
MNKLEQLHFDNHDYRDAAEITEQIAVEFAEWLGLNTIQTDNYLFQHNGIEKTIAELFQEFLKTKQKL